MHAEGMSAKVSDDDSRIRAFLAGVRRRLWLREALAATATIAAVGGIMGFALLWWAAGERSVVTLQAAPLVLATLSAAAWVCALLWMLRRWRGTSTLARFVGERAGLGDRVLSAVELAPRIHVDAEQGSSLARAHVAETARQLAEVAPRAVAPLWPSRPRAMAAATILLAGLATASLSRDRLLRGWTALRAPLPTPPAQTEPLVGDLDLELRFPDYTGLPPRHVPGSTGEVQAPPGTQVELRARPLVDVRRAHLELEDASGNVMEQRPVELDAGHLRASFTVGKAAAYRFVLERPRHRLHRAHLVREPEAHPITAEADRAPQVSLQAPADELELATPRPVQLAWSAEDDYGLREVELVWSWSSRERPHVDGRMTVRPASDGRAASGALLWELGALELPPGARLRYHLEARDNDDVNGPNVGRSREYVVRIDSPDEKHEELLGLQQALVDRAVGLLADRIEAGQAADPAGGTDAARRIERFSTARDHGADLLAELERLTVGLQKDPLASPDARRTLDGIHHRLAALHRQEAEPFRLFRAAQGDAQSTRALAATNPQHVAELERDVLLLDDLVGRQRIEQLLTVTNQMKATRDRLQRLLAEYATTRGDEVRQRIERELRELERRLAELQSKARRLQGEVADEYVNRDAIENDSVKKRIDSIRELLAKGDTDKAMEEMKRLGDAIDQLSTSLEGDLKGYRRERYSEQEKALAKLDDQLSDLEHDQRQLRKQTDEVTERQREAARRANKERVEPALKKAREQAAELQRRLEAVDRGAVPFYQQEDFDQARQHVEQLSGALERRSLEQARELARQAAGELHGLGQGLRSEEEARWMGARPPLRRAREHVEQGEALARRIESELEQAAPRPNELLSHEEQAQLDALSKKQEAVRRRVEELRRELGQRGDEQRGERGPLREAGEHMQRAMQTLRDGKPGDASDEQGQAADQLGKMRQQVREQRRPSEQAGSSAASDQEPVRIPGADEYHAPRQFRQDLLDAMKRATPPAYREQVKRYYEELTK